MTNVYCQDKLYVSVTFARLEIKFIEITLHATPFINVLWQTFFIVYLFLYTYFGS